MVLFTQFPSWISPYVIKGLPIRWYAVMYIVAFLVAYVMFRYQCKKDNVIKMNAEESQDLFFYSIIGLLIGARVGSCLFYSDTVYYLTHPWMMFWPFENGQFVGLPGMSYHGGLIGLVAGVYIYCRTHKRPFFLIADLLAAAIPLGYTFGRLGNFINGELYGKVSLGNGGMLFPYAEKFPTTIGWVRDAADKLGISYLPGEAVNLPRYPSQLYEALGEGIMLFIILFFAIRVLKYKKGWMNGVVLGAYLIGYGFIRFIIEYFRQPDADIGYVLSWGEKSDNIYIFQSLLNISKGQVFCFLMIIAGIALLAILAVFNKKRLIDDKRKTQKPKGGNGKGRR